MTVTKETLTALHARLQQLSVEATPEQAAYLAKSFETIAGRGRMMDIEELADQKIAEILVQATEFLGVCAGEKNSHVTEINSARDGAVTAISSAANTGALALNGLIDGRKPELEALLESFSAVNDLPTGSTILNEIQLEGERRKFIRDGALPFIFGILSRYNDYAYGIGHFSTELGTFGSAAAANEMLKLLTGSHNYTTQYGGFYKHPQLCFVQGAQGNFIWRELYSKYAATTSEYAYPYAALGVFFIKNTTNQNISTTLNCGGSAYAGYSEYSSLWVGTPNSQSKTLTWTAAYSCTTSTGDFAGTAAITIPANTTVAVMLFANAYYYTTATSTYAQFLHWYVHSFRSATLVSGLEIDVEKTLSAWQCKGISNTYELWS